MLAHQRLPFPAETTATRRTSRGMRPVAVVLLAWAASFGGPSRVAAEERVTANQEMPGSAARPLALAPREASPSPTLERRPGPSISDGRLKPRSSWWTAGSLVIVLALILVTARLLRHRLPLTATSLPGEVIEPLGRCQLDAKQSIYLVRCGKQILVLGSSGAGLSPLTTITDPGEVDRLSGLCLHSRRRSATDSFSHLLGRYTRGDETSTPSAAALPSPTSGAASAAEAEEFLREGDHV